MGHKICKEILKEAMPLIVPKVIKHNCIKLFFRIKWRKKEGPTQAAYQKVTATFNAWTDETVTISFN